MEVALSIVLLSGCTKEIKEESKKVNTKLTEKMLDISTDESKIFEGLEILNDNTLETKLGINRNYVEEYSIAINLYTYDSNLFIIIKPKKENREIVRRELELYIESVKNENKDKYERILK